MGLTRLVCAHPVVVSGLMVTAFGGWVAADASARKAPGVPPDPAVYAWAHAAPRLPAQEREWVRLGRVLTRFAPGMSRAEAEAIIREVATPAAAPDGRARYTAILLRPVAGNPGVTGVCDVLLVFDTTSPKQPLVRIECTPHDEDAAG